MSPLLRLLLACMVLPAIAGCQMTLLEQLPAGASRTCPQAWQGGFIGHDANQARDAAFGVFVEPGCKLVVFDREKDAKAAPVELEPQFFSGPGIDVMLLPNKAVVELLGSGRNADARLPLEGWLPIRWQRDASTMTLQFPDHRRLATLIVNGALDGETHWTGRDTGSNLLRGAPADLRDLLLYDRIFTDSTDAQLRAVGKTRRELERAVGKAHRAAQASTHETH